MFLSYDVGTDTMALCLKFWSTFLLSASSNSSHAITFISTLTGKVKKNISIYILNSAGTVFYMDGVDIKLPMDFYMPLNKETKRNQDVILFLLTVAVCFFFFVLQICSVFNT